MRREPDQHIATLLHTAIIEGGLHLDVIARRAGMSTSKLYALCERSRHLLAEDLPALHRAIGDPALFASLAGADLCGLIVAEAPAPAEQLTDSRRSSALKVNAAAGHLAEVVDRADSDGLVSDTEAADIERSISELERKAESLRQLLRARKMRVVG